MGKGKRTRFLRRSAHGSRQGTNNTSRPAVARNDEHLASGSRRGDCPDPGPPKSGIGFVQDRKMALHGLRPAFKKYGRSACHGCVGAAPGCCYQPVATSFLDALNVIAAFPALVTDRLPVIAEQAHREAPAGRKMPLTAEGAAQAKLGSDAELQSITANRVPCVFLTASGRCAIYAVRPWACAFYFTASPPRTCGPDQALIGGSSLVADTRQAHALMLDGEARMLISAGVEPVHYSGLAQAIVDVLPEAQHFGVDVPVGD